MAIQGTTARNKVNTTGTTRVAAVAPKTYRGFTTVNSDNTYFSAYDINLVKQDLLNHFHIRQGEKLENPNFGTIIWDLLFEPFTPSVKELIAEDVSRIITSDPRVKVSSINLTSYQSGIQIDCTLTYLPYDITETIRIKFDKDNNVLS